MPCAPSLIAVMASSLLAMFQAGENAATHYQRAFDLLSMNGAAGLVSSDEMNRLLEASDPSFPGRTQQAWRRQVQGIMARLGPVWESAALGAAAASCDWRLDRSKGFAMEMPHLGSERQLATVLIARAQMALDEGDAKTAGESLALGMRMASQAAGDRVLISSLVGMSIANRAVDASMSLLDSPELRAEDLAPLQQALKEMRKTDAFSCAESLLGEAEMLKQSITSPEQFAAVAGQLLGPETETIDTDVSSAQLEEAVAEVGGWYQTAAEIMKIEDGDKARAAMAELEAEMAASVNPLRSLMASLSKSIESMVRSDAMLADALRRVDAAAAEGGSSSPNAAELYRRVGAVVAGVSPENQETLELVRVLGAASPEEELALARRLAGRQERSVLLPLETASRMKRVEFDPRVAGPGPNLGLVVLPQVRGAIRMILSEAVSECAKPLAIGAGEVMQRDAFVSRRIGLAFAVAAHIASDPSISRAIWSMSMADEAGMALVVALERGALVETGKAIILTQIEKFPQGDPFQLAAGLAADRERLAQGGSGNNRASKESIAQRRQGLASLNTEQVLVMACANDPLLRALSGETITVVAPRELGVMNRPTDLLDLDACQKAHREASSLLSLPFYRSNEAAAVKASSPTQGMPSVVLLDAMKLEVAARRRLQASRELISPEIEPATE